jgi:hypothetical protein
MGQTARFQEPLRWLAMIGEGFPEDWADSGLARLVLARCPAREGRAG